MAIRIFNPIYLLGPPILVLVSIPLAIFAAVTTGLAIFALTFRASLVYIELSSAILQSWVYKSKEQVSYTPKYPQIGLAASPASAVRHQRYPSSAAVSSNASSQDLSVPKRSLSRRESWTSIVGTGSENRDYEGVGGWRITGEAEDDALWIGMNSRLELPAAVERKRQHHTRSLTSTSQRFSWSPEMRMSPMQSRARTPSVTAVDQHQHQEYFDLQLHGKRPDSYPCGLPSNVKDNPRRKSIGASSTSSNGSLKAGRISMKQTSFE